MIGKTFAQCTTAASLTRDLFVVLNANLVFVCPLSWTKPTTTWRLLTYLIHTTLRTTHLGSSGIKLILLLNTQSTILGLVYSPYGVIRWSGYDHAE